jgi:hypothetical protein
MYQTKELMDTGQMTHELTLREIKKNQGYRKSVMQNAKKEKSPPISLIIKRQEISELAQCLGFD